MGARKSKVADFPEEETAGQAVVLVGDEVNPKNSSKVSVDKHKCRISEQHSTQTIEGSGAGGRTEEKDQVD